MKKKRIVLISGHHGAGTGAVTPYLDEGKETIELKVFIAHELCTRYNIVPLEDGDFKSLRGVIARFKRLLLPADILLSLHFDACGNPRVSGSSVIIPDSYSAVERRIASQLVSVTSKTLGIRNRGVKFEKDTAHKRIGILRQPNATNLLLEVCFASNKSDVESYRAAKVSLAREIASVINYNLH